jgi:hypothetical protein
MKQHLSSNSIVTAASTAMLLAGFIAGVGTVCAQPTGSNRPPGFRKAADGGFTFDTGVLGGTLRAGGKSIGLSSLVHVPTGIRLDRGQGILSHYRVFTVGKRYGAGAWDWPSEARLRADGSVEVHWPAAERPFEMWAVYRIANPASIEVETRVKALEDLRGFESFLASYFSEGFTNASALVRTDSNDGRGGRLMPAEKANGDWQMFPRDNRVLSLIEDGRWQLEPHPVTWTIMPVFARPVAIRQNPARRVTALLISTPEDCFAVAMPYQTEGHYSTYLSLFGRDLKAGKTLTAAVRLVVEDARASVEEILKAAH